MKLFELTGIKSLAVQTPEDIIDALLEKGFFKKFLGSGVYGAGFLLPNNTVLKVWAADPAFEQYVDYCVEHRGNPYLLKVLGKRRKFKTQGHEFNFVRTELLTPITTTAELGYDDGKTTLGSILGVIDHNVVYEGYDDTAMKLDGSDESINHMYLDPEKASKKFRDFIKECFPILYYLRHNLGLELDLNKGNIGLRGDQIVLLDPVIDAFGDDELIELESLGIDLDKYRN